MILHSRQSGIGLHLFIFRGNIVVDDIVGNITSIFTLFKAKLELFQSGNIQIVLQRWFSLVTFSAVFNRIFTVQKLRNLSVDFNFLRIGIIISGQLMVSKLFRSGTNFLMISSF
jgi:hypothetical protein